MYSVMSGQANVMIPGLVAARVDVTTAQAWLGHSESRLTLDVYAQAVAEPWTGFWRRFR